MKRFRFATVLVNGILICSDASSPKEHFNAVDYHGEFREDILEEMHNSCPGIEDVRVATIYLHDMFGAFDYCTRNNITVL